MKFKLGDKVKFLNQKGGGEISKIISSTMVHVMIEDGFEIPTIVNELVKVTDNLPEPTDKPRVEESTFVAEKPQDETSIPLFSNIQAKKAEKGIYLAFIPHNQKWLFTGNLDISLINYTSQDVLFNLFLLDKENNYNGIDYDVIGPYSKKIIESIQRDDLENWCKGHIQLMFHKQKSELIREPSCVDFKIKPEIFLKEEQYIQSALINEKAFIYKLISMNTPKQKLDVKKSEEPVLKKAETLKPEHSLSPFLIDQHTAEIDLHIDQIIDNHKGYQAHEILEIQISHFIRYLEEAILHNISRIIFIHGGGKGTLKSEIMERLNNYSGIHYFDASYAKYGTGAIEVLIKQGAKPLE